MGKLIVGYGYLGSRVAALWRQQGEQVFATTRRPERADELRALGIKPIVCDVLDPPSLAQLPQVDVVLYGVALDRASGVSMRQVYVNGLANVLDRLPPPTRLIYVSSTSVYGQMNGEEVDESAATEPLDEAGRVVLEAEGLLRKKLPGAILLRFGGIYGPGRLLRQRDLEAGRPLGVDPDKWLNLIHVADGATAIVAAALRAQPGEVYNVCDGHAVPRRDFYGLLAELLKAPPARFVPPAGDAARPRDQANRCISNRKLREELGMTLQYPMYEAGLRDLLT